jgi:hypothetical protein
MITINDKRRLPDNVKFMYEMEPLEIGQIMPDNLIDGYDGDIVMRTASSCQFEVMNLSNMQKNKCWTQNLCSLLVRILDADITITLK